MTVHEDGSAGRALRLSRGPATWYAYLILSLYTYLLTIQGNIIPFLQAELDLDYRAAGLHPSAIAAGMIVAGLSGERAVRRFGRRRTLMAGGIGACAGAALLCLAGSAWTSIASCGLIGLFGGLIPTVVFALLADLHGQNRSIAYTEATALNYLFAIAAPLLVGLSLAVGLGWRLALFGGAALGIVIVAGFAGVPIPDRRRAAGQAAGALPAAYWAYWTLLALVVSIEFCALLWAPTFLQQVIGLPAGPAASAAAAFAGAMLVGRTAGSGLLRRLAAPPLFLLALGVALAGFLLYWGTGRPVPAVAGLFVLGLGVALLYPLTYGFAMAVAGTRGDAAAARASVAIGLAILSMPVLLGGLADRVGLRLAHLMLPALVAAALVCFLAARLLERREAQGAAGALP